MPILRTTRVTCLAAILLSIACVGCSATLAATGTTNEPGGSMRTVTTGQAFAMVPGDSVALSDHGTLRYVGLKSDSRCPPDRQCIWAGNAEVTFEWTAAGASVQSFELHTGFAEKRSRPLGENNITLVSLARGEKPEAQLRFGSTPAP